MEQKQNIELTPRKFITGLSKLHRSFTIAPVVLACVAYYLTPENYMDYMETSNPFFSIVPVVSIAGITLGNFLYAKQKKGLSNKKTLREKLAGLQSAAIIKYATIEGPALLSLIVFLKSGNLIYLVVAGLLIMYLIYERPSKSKIEQDLQLSYELKSQFNQLDNEID